jgi:multidrug efflux system outer membrane protein
LKTISTTHRRSSRAHSSLAPFLLPLGLLAACTVGPDYKRPDVSTPSTFRPMMASQEAASFADLPWWGAFNDPSLQALITEAMTNNYDVKIAVSRIEQARAALGVSRSELYPQLNYGLNGGGGRTIVQGTQSVGATTLGVIQGTIDFAWEMDLWGRIRRSNEAAQANLLAQEDVRRGVLLSLVTDVASGYFRLVALDRELAIAQESNQVFKGSFDLFDTRYKGGRDSALPVQRAQANYDESRARIEDVKRQIAQQENALSILLGSYPKDMPRGRTLLEQALPATPVGATSDLLQRRPDILAAEQHMVSANAEIGVAVADFFPRVGLSALIGFDWIHVANINPAFGVWNAALGATGPIFDGGRRKEVYNARKAFWDETVDQYRKTVLVAFQETSDALVAQQRLAPRREALEAQVADLRRSVSLAQSRYDEGRASYFEVLESEQQLFPAETLLAQTQRDQLLAVVDLYKALGGGWKTAPEDWAKPTTVAGG